MYHKQDKHIKSNFKSLQRAHNVIEEIVQQQINGSHRVSNQ